MKNKRQWSVRIERQPHRDAVRRFRKAYSLLWQMYDTTSVSAQSGQQTQKAGYCVQEVQK